MCQCAHSQLIHEQVISLPPSPDTYTLLRDSQHPHQALPALGLSALCACTCAHIHIHTEREMLADRERGGDTHTLLSLCPDALRTARGLLHECISVCLFIWLMPTVDTRPARVLTLQTAKTMPPSGSPTAVSMDHYYFSICYLYIYAFL